MTLSMKYSVKLVPAPALRCLAVSLQSETLATTPCVLIFDPCLLLCSHDEMRTQWEHPKTGKKKRCAGGLLLSLKTE